MSKVKFGLVCAVVGASWTVGGCVGQADPAEDEPVPSSRARLGACAILPPEPPPWPPTPPQDEAVGSALEDFLGASSPVGFSGDVSLEARRTEVAKGAR
jgi:hypothetical protein